MNTYSPTWNYIASGLNFLIENEVWKIENKNRVEPYKIPEGVRLILIIGFASVVEGSLKTYLIETLNKTFSEKDRIEKLINDANPNSEFPIQESETTFFPNPTKQELIKRKDKNDKLLIRIKNITMEQVESETWNNLIGLFNKITGKKLKDLLDNKRTDLYDDVNAIFSFRNFIIHSNNIQLQIHKENNFSFIDKSNVLIEYLRKNKLVEEKYKNEGKYFIECLMPEKIIPHFKKIVEEYLDVNFFKECPAIANLINSIHNE
jgi:hypothetical protein